MSSPWCWGRVAPCAPSSILGSEQSAMSCTRERAGEVKKGGINERRGRQRRRAGRWERCRGCSGIISSHPSVDRGFGIPRALLGTPQPALSCNVVVVQLVVFLPPLAHISPSRARPVCLLTCAPQDRSWPPGLSLTVLPYRTRRAPIKSQGASVDPSTSPPDDALLAKLPHS